MLGGKIARRLLDAGLPVRAMVRSTSDPDAVRRLEHKGGEIVVAGLKDAGARAPQRRAIQPMS
jgi:nucleoside-diphosphate-sugar epimerase